MDPNAVLRPVGPEPPGVYWRRRAVLVAGLVALVLVVAWACASAGGSGNTPAASRRTHAPATGTPTPTTTATASTGALLCRRADLKVTAATDAASYAAGALPGLRATLTNIGDHACRFNASPSARNWTIMSGPDQVWSTNDCPQSHGVAIALLRPGRSVTYSVAWNRHRSTKGCATVGAPADVGTYRLYATIDRITSGPAVFHLA